MDILQINDFTFKAILGIHPFEREMPQKLILSLALGVNCEDIAEKDTIDNNSLNYENLCQEVSQFACEAKCQLIETLAHKISEFLLTGFPIAWVKVTLTKPGALKNTKSVSITLERHAAFNQPK